MVRELALSPFQSPTLPLSDGQSHNAALALRHIAMPSGSLTSLSHYMLDVTALHGSNCSIVFCILSSVRLWFECGHQCTIPK